MKRQALRAKGVNCPTLTAIFRADLVKVARALRALQGSDAATFQQHAAKAFAQLGYYVSLEETAPCGGRIDIVVQKPDAAFAIELDRVTPRRKSLEKVRAFGAGAVITRSGKLVALLQNHHKDRVRAAVSDFMRNAHPSPRLSRRRRK